MNALYQTTPTPTYEDLLDIIAAQNFLIRELQGEIDTLNRDKERLLYNPLIIENCMMVKIG